MIEFTHRISYLRAEGAYAVLAAVQALEAQGCETIHLEIGQPDFETYPHIVPAVVCVTTTGQTRYSPPSGIPALRQALADEVGQQRGANSTSEQVVVAPGTMAMLKPGDEAIIAGSSLLQSCRGRRTGRCSAETNAADRGAGPRPGHSGL